MMSKKRLEHIKEVLENNTPDSFNPAIAVYLTECVNEIDRLRRGRFDCRARRAGVPCKARRERKGGEYGKN